MGELKYSLIVSILLHAAVIYIAATGLPYFARDLPSIERPIPVDLINIDDVTRVKETPPKPVEEEVEAQPKPTRARPQPPVEQVVPNPDLKPQIKPDPAEIERKKLIANVTPQAKPKPPSNFDAGQISALIDRSIKEKQQQKTSREKELEDAVSQSQVSGIQAQRNTATISDFIKRRMQECWSAPAGGLNVGELLVYVRFQLTPDGFFIGSPKIQNQNEIFSSGNPYHRAVADSALRAVRLCEPYELPRELYEQWKDLELKFDPSGMVG